MSTLIKISEINVFVGVTTQQALQEIFDCKRLLEKNNIPYANMIYMDDSQFNDIYNNLGTWLYGLDLTPQFICIYNVRRRQRNFPIRLMQ